MIVGCAPIGVEIKPKVENPIIQVVAQTETTQVQAVQTSSPNRLCTRVARISIRVILIFEVLNQRRFSWTGFKCTLEKDICKGDSRIQFQPQGCQQAEIRRLRADTYFDVNNIVSADGAAICDFHGRQYELRRIRRIKHIENSRVGRAANHCQRHTAGKCKSQFFRMKRHYDTQPSNPLNVKLTLKSCGLQALLMTQRKLLML